MSDLSWLNPTPHAIAVYASQPLSPVATQHSLPSGRYSLLGPVFHRLDRTSFAWRTHSITSSARASSVGGTVSSEHPGGSRKPERPLTPFDIGMLLGTHRFSPVHLPIGVGCAYLTTTFSMQKSIAGRKLNHSATQRD